MKKCKRRIFHVRIKKEFKKEIHSHRHGMTNKSIFFFFFTYIAFENNLINLNMILNILSKIRY